MAALILVKYPSLYPFFYFFEIRFRNEKCYILLIVIPKIQSIEESLFCWSEKSSINHIKTNLQGCDLGIRWRLVVTLSGITFLMVTFVFMSYNDGFLSATENRVTIEFDNKSKEYALAIAWGMTENY